MKTHVIKLSKTESITIALEGNAGTIETLGLKEPCPFCDEENCAYSCDESQAGGIPDEDDEDDVRDKAEHSAEDDERVIANAKIDGMTSTLLALACAGLLDFDNQKNLKTAIQTVLDAIGNED